MAVKTERERERVITVYASNSYLVRRTKNLCSHQITCFGTIYQTRNLGEFKQRIDSWLRKYWQWIPCTICELTYLFTSSRLITSVVSSSFANFFSRETERCSKMYKKTSHRNQLDKPVWADNDPPKNEEGIDPGRGIISKNLNWNKV